MARIRTIKPEFFRHEALQELGPLAMLLFAGLLCQADKNGVFPWKPKQLKLDILPFIDFDMEETLKALVRSGMAINYEVEGKKYGQILNFSKHQRITGTEAGPQGKRYPLPEEAKEKAPEPSIMPVVGNGVEADATRTALAMKEKVINDYPEAEKFFDSLAKEFVLWRVGCGPVVDYRLSFWRFVRDNIERYKNGNGTSGRYPKPSKKSGRNGQKRKMSTGSGKSDIDG